MRDILDKLKQINEGHLGMMADRVELDHEVQMARADLYKIAKYAIKLHEMLKSVSEIQGIEGWQQAKITKAADYLSSVYHNMDYEMSPMNPENAEAEQMDDMAFDLASESKEAVKEAGYTDAQRKSMDDMVKSVGGNPGGKTWSPKDDEAQAKKDALKALGVDDDPGMERDRTQGIDPDFSKRVQQQNQKNMLKNSKFGDWSKK